nr:LamG domain-containing protein [Bacteroidota bacterium]
EIDLSWTCTDPENDPLTYDVYFGDTETPPQVATGISDTLFTPSTLDYNTAYYWKIIAHDDNGNSTEGGVWSFTTIDESGANVHSLSFESGEYVRIPKTNTLSNFDQITVECWFYQTNLAGSGEYIVGTEHWGWIPPNTQTYIMNDWGEFESRLFDVNGTGCAYSDGQTIQENIWYHLAYTYDGETFRVFINGEIVYHQTEIAGPFATDDKDWVINRHTWDAGSSSRLSGQVDELRISSICRYTSDFTLQQSEFIVDENTMGLWHFDEGSGNQVLDASGNSNHGNVIGCGWSTNLPF